MSHVTVLLFKACLNPPILASGPDGPLRLRDRLEVSFFKYLSLPGCPKPVPQKHNIIKTFSDHLLPFLFIFFCCSFSPMGMPLAQAQMTPPAGCLTCVLIRSWWCTATTISSVASPPCLSPRAAVCCWPATMTLTATSGTLWKASVQVSDDWSLFL